MPSSRICSLYRDRWGSIENCLLFFCPNVSRVWKDSRFHATLRKANGLALIDVAVVIRVSGARKIMSCGQMMLWQEWLRVCKLTHPQAGEVELNSEISCVSLWETYQLARLAMEVVDKLGFVLGRRNGEDRGRAGCGWMLMHISIRQCKRLEWEWWLEATIDRWWQLWLNNSLCRRAR